MPSIPVLWSFRRCPYAMRARLAILNSGMQVELREILLRDKPARFLAASTKGTVPVLDVSGMVIDESRDIMVWALTQNDPDSWLDMSDDGQRLIDQCDGPFKAALDHTKYAVRYPDLDRDTERGKAAFYLAELDDRLSHSAFLTGDKRRLADMAIVPFVRQFANIDKDWFDAQGWNHLRGWLNDFLNSERFARVMVKYPPWQAGQDQVLFP